MMTDNRYVPAQRVSLFDTWFIYFGFVIYTSVLITPTRYFRDVDHLTAGESDPVAFASQTAALGILLWIFVTRWERIKPLLRHSKPYLLLLAICLLSTLWSVAPWLTLRRTITLATCVMFSIYAYSALGLPRLARLYTGMMIALGLLSIAMYILVPDIGRESTIDDYSAMRGVFAHKNNLALCLLPAIAYYAYRVIERGRLRSVLLPLAIMFLCILLSRSASGLLIAVMLCVAATILACWDKPRLRLLSVYALACFAVLLTFGLLVEPDGVFELIGRDASLTGRLPLWDLVLEEISERPFLGHGYNAFWNAESPETQYLWLKLGWEAPGAHNGYLELMVDFGVFGLLPYILIYLPTTIRSIVAFRSGTLPISSWVFLFMLSTFLLNLDEGPATIADVFTALTPAALIELSIWKERQKAAVGRTQPARRRVDLVDIMNGLATKPTATGAAVMALPNNRAMYNGRQGQADET